MIQFEECVISKLVVHQVGHSDSPPFLNEMVYQSNDYEEDLLLTKLLLKPFQSHTHTFEFAHEINLSYNVLFGLAQNIFEEEDFLECSKKIATHLNAVSKHPNINRGELFIVLFSDLQLGNKHHQALGIYKYEEKESYVETIKNEQGLALAFRKGLNNKKADKACLIICTDEPYTLLISDSNKQETDYWQNEFIKHQSKNDYVNNTGDFLTLAKTFITEQIPNEYEVQKTDQINLLSRSVDYFKKHETFDRKEFEEEVFEDKDIIKSFRNFDQNWQQEHALDISDQFEIAAQVVKKQARAFKSVLKLDKNFHIYIHGDRDLIEQGVDRDGRKFYKIYYDNVL